MFCRSCGCCTARAGPLVVMTGGATRNTKHACLRGLLRSARWPLYGIRLLEYPPDCPQTPALLGSLTSSRCMHRPHRRTDMPPLCFLLLASCFLFSAFCFPLPVFYFLLCVFRLLLSALCCTLFSVCCSRGECDVTRWDKSRRGAVPRSEIEAARMTVSGRRLVW